MTWVAVVLSLLAPVLAHYLGGRPGYHAGARFVPLLVFGSVIFAGYNVVVISIGRVRKTGANWIITGSAALVDVVLNIVLIPRVGAMGAPIALLVAYGTMFVAMSWHAQRKFYVPYQWRRVATLLAAGVGVVLIGKALSLSTPLALVLATVYPLALLLLGFYSPAERALLKSLLRRVRRAQPA
jgi:O-antigen/teichoic acid export membrane protein